MKRILAISFLVLALSSAWGAPADLESESHVIRQGNITEDLYVAGRSVRVDARAAGDVIAAGGQVQIEREVGGDVIAAGGQVDIHARVHDDVRAFGGQLRIGGNIGGDTVAAGGFVRLLPDAKVGGRAWLAGRNIEIDGDVAGEVRAAASTVTISGRITGDVFVRAKTLRLLPSTRIEGNLMHQGPTPPQVEQGAVISGDLDHEMVERPMTSMHGFAGRDGSQGGVLGTEAPRGMGYGASIVFVLMLLVAAFVYHLVFPRFSLSAAAAIGERPWATLGLGVAMLFVIPPVAVMLLATAIGAPVGMVAMLLYPVLLLLGFLTGMMFLCLALLRAAGPRHRGGRWLLLTLIPVFVILWLFHLFIPGVAAFVSLLALVFGTGAVTLQAMRARNTTQGETGAWISAALRGWFRRSPHDTGSAPPRDPGGDLIERPH